MYHIRMIPGTYYVPDTYHTCRCTINSTAVSPFVYSLVGDGTHDTYVPPKKQLYRYLFIRLWVVVSHERSARGRTRLTTVTYISCRSL